jgi:hypothetical protein
MIWRSREIVTVTKGFRRQTREWLAILATFVLLVHTAIAGVVDGAMASPQLLDVFGNVICTSHGADTLPGSQNGPAGHSHMPECCLAGCTVVGGHAVPPSAPATVPPALSQYAVVMEPARVGAAADSELSPLNPRAPPALI